MAHRLSQVLLIHKQFMDLLSLVELEVLLSQACTQVFLELLMSHIILHVFADL